jgi:hypothetical protein
MLLSIADSGTVDGDESLSSQEAKLINRFDRSPENNSNAAPPTPPPKSNLPDRGKDGAATPLTDFDLEYTPET